MSTVDALITPVKMINIKFIPDAPKKQISKSHVYFSTSWVDWGAHNTCKRRRDSLCAKDVRMEEIIKINYFKRIKRNNKKKLSKLIL